MNPKPSRALSVGTSLVGLRLSLCAPSAGGMGWIPGQGTKILHLHTAAKKKKNNPKLCSRPCDWRWKVKSNKIIRAVGPGVGDTKKNQNRTSIPECEWFREEK